MAKEAAIGIDLGTTYSVVGVFQNGKTEIIQNSQGNKLTPSVVAFTEAGHMVGEAALTQMHIDPDNTVYDTKRIIGRPFMDHNLQLDIAYWPFQVVDAGGKPEVQVEWKGKTRRFTPEEISAMLLAKMKATAEAFLGYRVKDAVVTVPAYFTEAQRQATRDAGVIAGLNVTRIINEPTAAAIAFGLDEKSKDPEFVDCMNVVVFDWGGGTFDVSVLTIDNGVFQVRGTAGDTHLGGADLDNRLVDYFADEFAFKHNMDLAVSNRALRRLRSACERAKRCLSSLPEVPVEIDSLFVGIDFCTHISRAKFEELCMDVFMSTLEMVDNALNNAGMDKMDINEIVLVGGSSRIPKVQSLLREYFNGKPLNFSVDPEEAVAVGAAIEATVLNGSQSESVKNLLLMESTPLSLGIESAGGIMTKVIPRNTNLPAHAVHYFTTNTDNQQSVTVKIFEGERAMTRENRLIGVFDLTGIKPAARGKPRIEVKFDVDVDGILSVAAINAESGVHERVEIQRSTNISAEEIQRMISEAKEYEFEDKQERLRVKAKIRLETFIFELKDRMAEGLKAGEINEEEVRVARERLDRAIRWVDRNQYEAEEEYTAKCAELSTRLGPTTDKLTDGRGGGKGLEPHLFQLEEPSEDTEVREVKRI